jgi:hypothetical protein
MIHIVMIIIAFVMKASSRGNGVLNICGTYIRRQSANPKTPKPPQSPLQTCPITSPSLIGKLEVK